MKLFLIIMQLLYKCSVHKLVIIFKRKSLFVIKKKKKKINQQQAR